MPNLVDTFKRARGDVVAKQLARRSDRRAAKLAAKTTSELTNVIQSQMRTITSQTQALATQSRTITEINYRLKRLESHLGSDIVQKTDVESWAKDAQQGELGFHKRPNVRSSDTWESGNARFWRDLGFESSGWAGKTVLDVGAGSRLRTLYFEGAEIIALEPLAEQFAAEVEWQDIDKADEVHAVPAETLIPGLVGRADLIVSINALDHGYDFAASIHNLRRYIKEDGQAFLSFDQHDIPDKMHPLVLNDELVRKIFDDAGFEVEKMTTRRRYHAGTGPDALSYWLRPTA